MKFKLSAAMICGCVCIVATAVRAAVFNVPGGDLETALNAFTAQSSIQLVVSSDAIRGVKTHGTAGNLSPDAALLHILAGTGFTSMRDPSGAITIVRGERRSDDTASLHVAAAPAPTVTGAALETVTVTSSKIGGDVQNIPISITALSQDQLTATQTAGGPDLVKQVPNMTFTKTNFSGYSIQIRGIGTQAISVTTDPAVAVALNDTPFIRNHFFEQEFYDVGQVEVLRGPQGTLYGRNATAGVVNLVSAKPSDQFEALASVDLGNYQNRRFEGMVNFPIVDDRLDVRLAGEWTKRQGYTTNALTGDAVDGRDLWSSRFTIGWKPLENLQAYLVWEHFSEDDDRMRTAKQLCKTDPGLTSIHGVDVPLAGHVGSTIGEAFSIQSASLSQGCLPAGLYSPQAFEVPNGYSLPYVVAGDLTGGMNIAIDPYASATQSRNLRVIETQIDPRYQAKNNTVEMNADYNVTPALTLTSQTGFNQDFLWSTEDYNRFNTNPGIFSPITSSSPRSVTLIQPNGHYTCYLTGAYVDSTDACDGQGAPIPSGTFCDPQLGCSDRLVAQDVSSEHAWQLSQEIRLASNFSGPFNFSAGANYMHYETEENYYVFSNALTLFAADEGIGLHTPWVPGVTTNLECLQRTSTGDPYNLPGRQYNDPHSGPGTPTEVCYYIDPNSLSHLNDGGHNYFLSKNPYVLNSYAGFGEAYYNVLSDLKLTGGLRWTDDQKHFIDIPSELLAFGYGYASTAVVNQQWDQLTGRLAANWTPKLDFTDQTLIYGSYAHGYKAGGANPPGAVVGDLTGSAGASGIPIHPLTFKPEFVDAYELGSKNTMLDGSLTLNGDIFFYNYKAYQISEIVDRTSINLNFDATVKGAELEATYEPVPGLRFRFAGGYEDTRIADGQQAVDLMDRTAGHAGWVVMKPAVTESSNCIFPDYVVAAALQGYPNGSEGNEGVSICGYAYNQHVDPITQLPYVANPTVLSPGSQVGLGNITGGYIGFDPTQPAINDGAGFAKDLGGNQLPNAPPFTASFSAEYTIPITVDWAGTLRGDYYWQDYSWARVFNDDPYDRLRGYTNVNLAVILTSQSGWQVMGYAKNIFNVTAITGDFLNSDDSGLTTNIFLTDPRLLGVRVTKNW